MFTRVFITDGAGFVGRHLISTLRASGTEVRAQVSSETEAAAVRDLGATPISCDLDNQEALKQGMEGCDVVFHLVVKRGDWGPYEDFHRVNVLGTEHVLTAARAAGVPKLVYNSTESVLLGGPPIVNVDETRPKPRHPLGAYAKTMGIAEDLVLAANTAELSTVIIRSRLNWGPGDTVLLPQFIAAARSGKLAFINGGRHLTSTCHVTNLCEGLLLAAEKGQGGEIYFLSDGSPIELKSFATACMATAGVDAGNRSIPLWLAKLIAPCAEFVWIVFKPSGKPPLTRATVKQQGEEITVNDAKARRELGYVGKVSREEGLAALRASSTPDSVLASKGGEIV